MAVYPIDEDVFRKTRFGVLDSAERVHNLGAVQVFCHFSDTSVCDESEEVRHKQAMKSWNFSNLPPLLMTLRSYVGPSQENRAQSVGFLSSTTSLQHFNRSSWYLVRLTAIFQNRQVSQLQQYTLLLLYKTGSNKYSSEKIRQESSKIGDISV